ncbi:MAG: SdpI family protein [Clostridia bacterium]|nr:SdpI family protein [Clostridia bacterium]
MIKNNKLKLIISSIVIMLPALVGIFWGKSLPEKIATHWGFDGEADGFMNPTFAFILIPSIILAVHWLCIILTAVIDKNTEQNKKVTSLIFFIMPVISLFSCGMTLAIALGYTPNNIFALVLILLAAAFILIGNYLPKTTRNRTMGIKIKWTLSSDENWQATHRFAGKVYVITGLICLLAIPLPLVAFPFVALAIILASSVIPTVYSYRFYKKQIADGTVTKEALEEEYASFFKKNKIAVIVTVILVAVLVIVLSFVMFTGDIEATLGDTFLSIEADFFDDLTLDYDKIDSIEYRENGVDGTRIYGFASSRLLLGAFSNDEFGSYTRYTYTGKNPCIVIKSGEKTLVLGTRDANETKALYDKLIIKTN